MGSGANYEALFADLPDGIGGSGEVKDTPIERLQLIFNAMHQTTGSFVLFVDHFHRLVGGEGNPSTIDASTLLKPILACREIKLIGTCTLEQYRRYIDRNAPIQRCCQPFLTSEADGEPAMV